VSGAIVVDRAVDRTVFGVFGFDVSFFANRNADAEILYRLNVHNRYDVAVDFRAVNICHRIGCERVVGGSHRFLLASEMQR
jgi:hypothetical protein